jgi:germination protein M
MPARPTNYTKLVIAVVAAAALVVLVWGARRYRTAIIAKMPAAVKETLGESGAAGPVDVKIYFADAEYTELAPESRAVLGGGTAEEMARAVVTELIAGPREPSHSPTIPREARLLSVFLQGTTALLNFNEGLQSPRFGTTGELFAINSLYRTVTENVEGVDSVIILVDGKMFQTLAGDGGHIAEGFPIYGELGRYVSGPAEKEGP